MGFEGKRNQNLNFVDNIQNLNFSVRQNSLSPHLLCDSHFKPLNTTVLVFYFFCPFYNSLHEGLVHVSWLSRNIFHDFDKLIAQLLPCLVFEQRISEQSCLSVLELQQNDFRVLFLTKKTNCKIKLYFKLNLYITVGVHT